MKSSLRVKEHNAKQENSAFYRTFYDRVRLYYFTFDEAVSLLRCDEAHLKKLLGRGRYDEVEIEGRWMIPPDKISLLRRSLWRALNG